VSFIDDSVEVDSLTYTTTVITGDADELLEPGELFEISVSGLDTAADISANDIFTLQVQPPSGAILVVRRTVPSGIAETIVNMN
jgi:archaellin